MWSDIKPSFDILWDMLLSIKVRPMIYAHAFFMMTSSNGNIFRVTGPLREESTDRRWSPLTNASGTELWCFLWYALEQTVKQTIETRSRSLWRHCNFWGSIYSHSPGLFQWYRDYRMMAPIPVKYPFLKREKRVHRSRDLLYVLYKHVVVFIGVW